MGCWLIRRIKFRVDDQKFEPEYHKISKKESLSNVKIESDLS